MIFRTPIPLTDALVHQAAKRVLALSPSIGTAEMDQLDAAIRAHSFYSARTPYASYLAETQSLIQNLVQPDAALTPTGLVTRKPGESISPAQVRARMKKHLASLNYSPSPDQAGGLLDLSSDRRVNLIIDTQLKMSRGYGSWRQGQDPTVLQLWPADELYRAMFRATERDWQTRWNAARSSLSSRTTATRATGKSGPFVARKNDPIWSEISRFKNPYPPFDYASGMRVRDVERRRAIALRVISATETVPPQRQPFPSESESLPPNLPPLLVSALRAAFSEFRATASVASGAP